MWCVPALRVPLVHSLINDFRKKTIYFVPVASALWRPEPRAATTPHMNTSTVATSPLACGTEAYICGSCPSGSSMIRQGSNCSDERNLKLPECRGECKGKQWQYCRGGGSCVAPFLKDTVLLVLLCQPRMGSSLVESLLGESPEVPKFPLAHKPPFPPCHSVPRAFTCVLAGAGAARDVQLLRALAAAGRSPAILHSAPPEQRSSSSAS